MELQWPLILFTTLVSWSAGLFGTQGLLAARGRATASQLPALVVSLALLVIGGIAVFFHLEHWERIFNGFGHITSGITQELIGIVAMFLVMVAFFAALRRTGGVPRWCGALALVVAVALVAVMGHSYMMASRPAWDSIVQIASLLGASCAFGPATFAVIMAVRGDDLGDIAPAALVGVIVNAATSIGYLVAMGCATALYSSLGYYYDPTQITSGMLEVESATSLFEGGRLALVVAVVVCAAAPVALAVIARKRDAAAWKPLGAAIAVVVAFGAITLRVLFYELGISVLPYY